MLKNTDKDIFDLIEKERAREESNIELIASENFVSKSILEAMGTVLTNKYADGYPNARDYGGCEFIDGVETLAIERCKELFKVKYANVQPYSGTNANMAVFFALLNPNDTILSMDVNQGGHITHGDSSSYSKIYNHIHYHVTKDTYEIDYDEVENKAKEYKPKIIVAGASAYPYLIDYKRFKEIAKKYNALLLVDMAHLAGIIAAGLIPSPVPYADIITSTTHKTLRGPRGGLIITNDEALARKIDAGVFPGVQGGPLMHVIAGKAVSFKEALSEKFVEYQKQILTNTTDLFSELKNRGYVFTHPKTYIHLIIMDVYKSIGLDATTAEKTLEYVGLTVNKMPIPYDTNPNLSGLRIGLPAVTSRGFLKHEIEEIARIFDQALRNYQNQEKLDNLKVEVRSLSRKFPLQK